MKTEIIKILNEIRPEFDFSEEVDFIEQGMLDSFDIILLVTRLDERFGTSIDGMDILPHNFGTPEAIEKILIKNGAKL
jgi:acyl carrier protein